jgi:hypothetical protein
VRRFGVVDTRREHCSDGDERHVEDGDEEEHRWDADDGEEDAAERGTGDAGETRPRGVEGHDSLEVLAGCESVEQHLRSHEEERRCEPVGEPEDGEPNHIDPAVLVTLASTRAAAIWDTRAPTSIVRRPTRWSTWPATRLEIAKAKPNEETTMATIRADSVCWYATKPMVRPTIVAPVRANDAATNIGPRPGTAPNTLVFGCRGSATARAPGLAIDHPDQGVSARQGRA